MISFKVVIGSLFGLLVVAITVLGVLFYQDSQNRVMAAGRVSHSFQAIVKTEEVYSAYKDVQLQASILADTKPTADYQDAKRRLYAKIDTLQDLMPGNDAQLRIDSLSRTIRLWSHFMDSLLLCGGNCGGVDKNGALAQQAESTIIKLKHLGKTILVQRQEALQETVMMFIKTLSMLTIAIAILLVATFLTVRYNFNKRKAAEDQIKNALQVEVELNRLKSGFVTLASHEFRTPLTTILSSAFLLEKYLSDVSDQERAIKHISRIKSSVGNLTSILDEFLSVTKIEEGQVQPNIEVVDLPEFLGSICNDLQTFARPGQVIRYSHTGPQEVKTDPVLLGNIVRNIVTNSIKYSPENSPIAVSSTVNSNVHVVVADKGIGIPVADQKHLFERFYRASNAGAVQGTGLGLHIMKHYVQMLNGSVKLQSEVGKGTRVDVTFGDVIAEDSPR